LRSQGPGVRLGLVCTAPRQLGCIQRGLVDKDGDLAEGNAAPTDHRLLPSVLVVLVLVGHAWNTVLRPCRHQRPGGYLHCDKRLELPENPSFLIPRIDELAGEMMRQHKRVVPSMERCTIRGVFSEFATNVTRLEYLRHCSIP